MDFLFSQLQSLYSSNPFFQGGLVLAALSWFFYQAKALPLWVWSKIRYAVTYETYFDEKSDFYDCFAEWMAERFPQKFRRTEVKIVDGNAAPVYPGEAPRAKGFRLRFFQSTDSNFLFYRRRLLFVKKNREKLENSSSLWTMHLNSYSISGMFAKDAIEKLCDEILQVRYRRDEEAGLEVRYNSGEYFTRRIVPVTKTFDHLFFAEKTRLVGDLDTFSASRQKYFDLGINYKRGYLLYGTPGTGKTSIAVAIARHLKRPLFVINLASVSNDKQLQMLALEVTAGSVILFEDIDCLFEKREVKGNDDLNFATILNVLDGLYSPSDCVFVLTTNKPESIDDALLRKGRIDLTLHIDNPTITNAGQFVSTYYGRDARMTGDAKLPAGMSAIQDICLRNDFESARQEILDMSTRVKSIAA